MTKVANVLAANDTVVEMHCPGCGRGYAIYVNPDPDHPDKAGILDTDVLACQYPDCNRAYLAPDFALKKSHKAQEPGMLAEGAVRTTDFDPDSPKPVYTVPEPEE